MKKQLAQKVTADQVLVSKIKSKIKVLSNSGEIAKSIFKDFKPYLRKIEGIEVDSSDDLYQKLEGNPEVGALQKEYVKLCEYRVDSKIDLGNGVLITFNLNTEEGDGESINIDKARILYKSSKEKSLKDRFMDYIIEDSDYIADFLYELPKKELFKYSPEYAKLSGRIDVFWDKVKVFCKKNRVNYCNFCSDYIYINY